MREVVQRTLEESMRIIRLIRQLRKPSKKYNMTCMRLGRAFVIPAVM
jgi:hypothetical protein